ncbi:MAG: NAD(+)/NADH kinase [Chloroflexota bacterium]
MTVSRVGILYHPRSPAAYSFALEVKEFLTRRVGSLWVCSAWEEEKALAEAGGTGLIITVGGDGTILRAAQMALKESIPITGINLGRLGFMTELGAGEALSQLPSLLAGEGWLDERAMLEAELEPKESGPSRVFQALNDVVVSRGEVARVLYIETSIDDRVCITYKADGVIVATATGSTGYSLAAGGPILHPQAPELILVPSLPHLSLGYPLVLPPATVMKFRVCTTHSAALSIDGHINLPLRDGAVVTVRKSTSKVRFLRVHRETSFYSTLERRLRGSAD